MGYSGGDDVAKKILRRSLYALGVMSSGLLCAFILGGGAWILFAVHIGIGLFSVFLGTKNLLPAAVEEPLICVLLNLILVCYPFL